jgi:membrane fusion protein, copper/silver efflux system
VQFSHKVILGLVLVSGAFLAGYWVHQPGAGSSRGTVRQPLYYQCPMHPAYKSDKPGDAPCCGMKLVPVYADGPATPAAGTSRTPGGVRISLEKQQFMGLKTVPVARSAGSYTLRVLGRVAADESRIRRITALADGVVRTVSPVAVGNLVQKDDLLARYFVSLPEVYSAMQSYFVAMNLLDQRLALKDDPRVIDQAKAQIRLSEELLATYGMSEKQIRELARTRETTRDIDFRSPVSGLVLLRNVAVGQRAARGDELFRIAELSRVWVLADLFENESGLVQAGATAQIRYQQHVYRAAVSDARQFDPASRTLKVRLELDNPGLRLRPDMFVDVELRVREPEGISVPVDALVDAGRRQAVFVATGEGAFEPREVVTGARYGDRVQIVKGLQEGENVVVSGLFLLDSESRLQLAATTAAPATTAAVVANSDPVCGMEVDAKAAHQSEYNGATYRFCSKDCKQKFDLDPARHAGKKGGQS